MRRDPCCSEEGLNRGAWTIQEDRLLSSYIVAHGEGKWTHIPQRAGLNRSGKSCRLRWLNYLRPDIKRGNITQDEEELIIRLHKLLGNRWSLIAGRLPGRTDNEIKNYWNTTLAKKLRSQSCSMSEQHPSSKLTESQPEVSGAQVIKTRATRCKNVVILDPPCPKEKENWLASNQMRFNEVYRTTQFKNGTQCSHSPKARGVNEYHNSDVDMLSCRRSVEFQEDAADFCRDFILDSSMGMVMDGHAHSDQSLPVDKLMVNCWTTSESLDVNATMDLDSLALLLDSGNWP